MRLSKPPTVVVAVVMLFIGAVALLATGVAAIVLRDNDLARLPVLLYEVDAGDGALIGMDTDQGLVLVVAGAVAVVIALLVGLFAVATARGSRLAWAVVVTVAALTAVAAVVVGLADTDFLRWALLVTGLLALVVSGLLLTSSARAFVAGRSRQRRDSARRNGEAARA